MLTKKQSALISLRCSIIILLFAGGTIASARLTIPVGAAEPMTKTIDYLRSQIPLFYQSTQKLFESIEQMNENDASISIAKEKLKSCRIRYKKLSFWLEYFFPIQAQTYNPPAKFEVENSSTEFEPPHGLQQMEALLYANNPLKSKEQILAEAKVIKESAQDLQALLYDWSPSYSEMMESIRLELIRVMALYIEGYDAQFLKSGLSESVESLESVRGIFNNYIDQSDSVGWYIDKEMAKGIDYLEKNANFDGFDRLKFLREYMMPLETAFNAYLNSKIPGKSFQSLFNKRFFGANISGNINLQKLGYRLFFERTLSRDGSRSCASCHSPEKYFADGLARNSVLGMDSLLSRNTPTLLYASHQSRQFWDGRATTLEDQIKIVLTNSREMRSSSAEIEKRLNDIPYYKKEFAAAFNQGAEKKIQFEQVCAVIAAYLNTLSPMGSNFDKYMEGNDPALSSLQKKGFNLFAGKAQCATCHFIPLFNGLIPPLYNRSEFEVLGVPATEDLEKPLADPDSGYYVVSPNRFNLGAFKTPTVRNISKTGPYMHNGAFRSLEQVVEFYNKGGGVGLGLRISNQTLSEKPLRLSKAEEKAIVAFLESLTDPEKSLDETK